MGRTPAESVELEPEPAHSYDLPQGESVAAAPTEEGEVADFRRSLANLAAQAELDRIAFLRDGLAKRGDPVPTLEEIAADVKGDKLLQPEGDFDLYGLSTQCPSGRLAGWACIWSPEKSQAFQQDLNDVREPVSYKLKSVFIFSDILCFFWHLPSGLHPFELLCRKHY